MESPRPRLAYYPLPFAILAAWIGYIIFMVVQLEKAVAASKHTWDDPWHEFTNSQQEMLTLLLTVFAQAHTPITTMVLARLAVGALSLDGESSFAESFWSKLTLTPIATAPKTWLEVFFLADGDWQGPLGIARALWISHRRKTRLSSTFALFGVTILLSLPQPLLISRAYPYQVVTSGTSIINETAGGFILDDYLATGLTAWRVATTGDAYEGFAGAFYQGNESSLTYGDDVVFSTIALQSPALQQPALWLSGSCTHLKNTLDLPTSGVTPYFGIWCSTYGLRTSSAEQFAFEEGPLSFAMHWCSNVNSSWNPSRSGVSTTSVIAWLNATGPSRQAVSHLNRTGSLGAHRTHVEGFFNCTYSVASGSATLFHSRQDPTYSDFETYSGHGPEISPAGRMLGNHLGTIWAPVYAVYAALAQIDTSDHLTIPRLFFASYGRNFTDITQYYLSADVDDMAFILDGGVSTMHAALATLGMPLISEGYNSSSSPVRQRNAEIFIAAVTVLGAWLVSLVICCRRMFSRTFSGSLNSYVAARLLYGALRFAGPF
jgi:hypothetical protein